MRRKTCQSLSGVGGEWGSDAREALGERLRLADVLLFVQRVVLGVLLHAELEGLQLLDDHGEVAGPGVHGATEGGARLATPGGQERRHLALDLALEVLEALRLG